MRAYKLFSNTTGANNGVASLKITKPGRVRAIAFSICGLGGAGVSRMEYEVSKQNTSSLATNDTPETVMASCCIASPNAVHFAENFTVLCDLPVGVGDTIYLNTSFNGAVAPASASANIYLYV